MVPTAGAAMRSRTDRLADVVYRTACLAAVVWAAFVFVVTATLALPDLDYSDAHCGRWGFRHLVFWSCRSPFLNSALTTIEIGAVICHDVFRRTFSDLSTHGHNRAPFS